MTPQLIENIISGFRTEEGEGFISAAKEALNIAAVEKLAEGCGITRTQIGFFKYKYLQDLKPALFREIDGKKHKLIGLEEDKKEASTWAAKMEERSGEKIREE